MGAVTEVAEVHPDTKDLPLKKRVWGFRTPARYCIRKFVSQAAESRRENAPAPTNIASGISQFLLTDQVGTLRAVADTSGAIVKRIDYDSFGNIIADTNPSFSVPFGFAGGLHDRDTGLVRFGYRDYSPELGRFVAKDPIDFAGGDTNLYAYAMNDPVNFADPQGLLVIGSEQGPFMLRLFEKVGGEPFRLQWRYGGELHHLAEHVKRGVHYANESAHYYCDRKVMLENNKWVEYSYPALARFAGRLLGPAAVAAAGYEGYNVGSWLAAQPVPNLVGADQWNVTFGNAFSTGW
jgi:RHS repeat-associated protein